MSNSRKCQINEFRSWTLKIRWVKMALFALAQRLLSPVLLQTVHTTLQCFPAPSHKFAENEIDSIKEVYGASSSLYRVSAEKCGLISFPSRFFTEEGMEYTVTDTEKCEENMLCV
ncbi:hypothetical protein CEXT_170261 [Caerostris extrusa]|uniref:Uncharacterized protein n=1 Tax=Caerostris extrusa TaxID=172846 RepID=A0AAV4U628_CAEEX|nr:hypothetical protein CEXT_170261 [Caerostris extrusa]